MSLWPNSCLNSINSLSLQLLSNNFLLQVEKDSYANGNSCLPYEDTSKITQHGHAFFSYYYSVITQLLLSFAVGVGVLIDKTSLFEE